MVLEDNNKHVLSCEAVWKLNQQIEHALSSIRLPVLAEWLEEVTQESLTECAKLLLEAVKCFLDARALCEMKVQPVIDWNEAEWGCTVEEAGMLPAYTGFSCMFLERKITMPNFCSWKKDSEFVRYKLKVVQSESLGRLYRQMFIICIRAPCHELLHCLQQLCGQRMHTQLAEHDAYFGADVLARSVIPLLKNGYPGLREELQLTALGVALQKYDNPPREMQSEHFLPAYLRWRDTFGGGAQVGLWNDSSFKTEFGSSAEFIAGQLLNTEASILCPSGQETLFIHTMIQVMFASRDAATHPSAIEKKTLDLTKIEVVPPALLSLKGIMPLFRFQEARTAVQGSHRAAFNSWCDGIA